MRPIVQTLHSTSTQLVSISPFSSKSNVRWQSPSHFKCCGHFCPSSTLNDWNCHSHDGHDNCFILKYIVVAGGHGQRMSKSVQFSHVTNAERKLDFASRPQSEIRVKIYQCIRTDINRPNKRSVKLLVFGVDVKSYLMDSRLSPLFQF